MIKRKKLARWNQKTFYIIFKVLPLKQIFFWNVKCSTFKFSTHLFLQAHLNGCFCGFYWGERFTTGNYQFIFFAVFLKDFRYRKQKVFEETVCGNKALFSGLLSLFIWESDNLSCWPNSLKNINKKIMLARCSLHLY